MPGSNRFLIKAGLLTILWTATAWASGHGDNAPDGGGPSGVSEEQLFQEKCLSCHDQQKGKYGNLFGLKIFDHVIGMKEATTDLAFEDATHSVLEDIRGGNMPPEGDSAKPGENISLKPEEKARLEKWLEKKLATRKKDMEVMQRRIAAASPGETVRYRMFNDPKEHVATYDKFLTLEDFGEPTLQLRELDGTKGEKKVCLYTVESLIFSK